MFLEKNSVIKQNLIAGEKIRNEQKRVHCTLIVQPGAQDDYRSVFLHEPKMHKPRGYRRMPMHALSHTCCSLRRHDNKAMRLFESLTAHGTLAKLTVRLLCVNYILLSCCFFKNNLAYEKWWL